MTHRHAELVCWSKGRVLRLHLCCWFRADIAAHVAAPAGAALEAADAGAELLRRSSRSRLLPLGSACSQNLCKPKRRRSITVAWGSTTVEPACLAASQTPDWITHIHVYTRHLQARHCDHHPQLGQRLLKCSQPDKQMRWCSAS